MKKISSEHMLLCPAWAPPDPRGTFIALALAGEAGELANMFKKEWRDGLSEARRQQMADELGDVMVYARAMAQHLGVDLVKESDRKLKAFEKRPEYPRLLEEARRRTNEALNVHTAPSGSKSFKRRKK